MVKPRWPCAGAPGGFTVREKRSGGGRKTGEGEAAGGAWTGVQRGFTTGEWNEAAGLARWAAARLEQRCFCWAAQLLLLLPFFSFLQTENKTEKHMYNGEGGDRYENIPGVQNMCRI